MAIGGYKSNALRRFYQRGELQRIHPAHRKRIADILFALSRPNPLKALALPAYHLHPLTGDRKDQWAVRVDRSWRIVFRIEGGRVFDVDLVDYH